MRQTGRAWAYLLVAFVVAAWVYSEVQLRNTLNNGAGYDGTLYAHATYQLVHGRPLEGPPPFAQRIGFPVLTALTHDVTGLGIMDSGLVVGLFFAFAACLALDWFLRMHGIKPRTAMLFCTLYLVHFMSPLRGSIYSPMNLEGLVHFTFLLGLILVQRRTHWLGVLAFSLVAAPIREVTLVIPLIYLLQGLHQAAPDERRRVPWLLKRAAPLMAAGAVFALVTHLVAVVPTVGTMTDAPYTFVGQALKTLYTQTFVSALFSALLPFGCLFWLCAHRPRMVVELSREQPALAWYVLLILGLALVGGTDTDRFMFWAFPVMYLVCAKIWDECSIAGLLRVVTLLLLMLSERVLWALPNRLRFPPCMASNPCRDYRHSPVPILHFQSEDFQLLDLHPHSGVQSAVLIAVAEHLLCIVALVLAQRSLDRSARHV